MSKYDLPELPSDEELGITNEDREQYGESEDRPELSEEERAGLLGDGDGRAGGGAVGSQETAGEKAKADPDAAAPSRVAGRRSRWRGPVTLALLIGLAAFASSSTGLPRPVPANASDTAFSSSRAMSILTDIAREPHPTGSPEHARVRDYLVERLRALGLEPEVQTTTSVVQVMSGARTATVRNVIARLPGTASTGAVLLTAHYDSRELSPGAGDDGAGVVTILEAVRSIRSGDPLRNDVIVLFTDAEELGLLGARAFVDRHPWIREVALVISFEMRGGGGPSIMFETNNQNGWVVRALQAFDPKPFANSLAAEVYERMPNDTDFTPFRAAGKQGLNFAAIGNAHVHHQATDTPENLSEATLQHHGIRAVAALRHLGGADLGVVDAPDVVYFTVPALGLVAYDAVWVLPIMGGLVLLLLLVGLAAVRSGARIGGLLTGLGLSILGAALSYALALGLSGWVARFHPERGSLAGSMYHTEGWYVLALAAAVFVLVTTLHAIARRWLSPPELTLGAAVVPLCLAAWASFAAPLAAMDVQWPVAAALLATLVLALLPSRSSAGVVGWIVTLMLVVPVFIFLVPLTELVWLSLTFRVLGVVAVLVAITLQLSIPALDALRHPNGWWAPLTAVAVAAATLWVGVASARSGPGSPAPSTLLYAYEHGTGSAYWITDPAADLVLDEEAIGWAEERAGAPFAATADLRDFGLPWEQAPIATAPIVAAAPPEVVILRDTVEAGVRRVTLAARSRIGAERLTFTRDPNGRVRFLSVDGIALDQPTRIEWIDHWGVPDTTVVLELDMPAGEPIGVHVLEDHLRPEEFLGAGAFGRPDDLAPDVEASSDRAIFRYSIAAFADPRHAFMPAAAADSAGVAPGLGAAPGVEAGAVGGAAPGAGGAGGPPGSAPDTSEAAPGATAPPPDSSAAVPQL